MILLLLLINEIDIWFFYQIEDRYDNSNNNINNHNNKILNNNNNDKNSRDRCL